MAEVRGWTPGGPETIALHALMGGLAAEAYGGDFVSGALAAGVNKLLVAELNTQFESLTDTQRNALLVMSSQLIGVMVAAVHDPYGDGSHLETAAWVTRNATQYNFLNHANVEELEKRAAGCLNRDDCAEVQAEFIQISDENRERLANCEVNGNCQAILAEIEQGRETMNALRGEAYAVARGELYSRQIEDHNQARISDFRDSYREANEFAERTQRDHAERMLAIAEDPADAAAWIDAHAREAYALEKAQELMAVEAELDALSALDDDYLDEVAPGWREYREQLLISSGYVKDGAALVGDMLEPGLLDAIGPAAKAARLLGVLTVVSKADRAIPDELAALSNKLGHLVSGKPPTPAEMAPFRQTAEARLQEEVRQASLVMGKGDGAKGAVNITAHAADDIRFSQNTVSFNKTDRVTGTNYTYNDLVQSMRTNGWKGDPVDVVKMPDGKLTSMDNTRIAAAREAGIEVKATVRGFDDPLTPAIQEARGWQSFSTWGEAITARINKQSGGFSNSNPYGSSGLPRVTGGGN